MQRSCDHLCHRTLGKRLSETTREGFAEGIDQILGLQVPRAEEVGLFQTTQPQSEADL